MPGLHVAAPGQPQVLQARPDHLLHGDEQSDSRARLMLAPAVAGKSTACQAFPLCAALQPRLLGTNTTRGNQYRAAKSAAVTLSRLTRAKLEPKSVCMRRRHDQALVLSTVERIRVGSVARHRTRARPRASNIRQRPGREACAHYRSARMQLRGGRQYDDHT